MNCLFWCLGKQCKIRLSCDEAKAAHKSRSTVRKSTTRIATACSISIDLASPPHDATMRFFPTTKEISFFRTPPRGKISIQAVKNCLVSETAGNDDYLFPPLLAGSIRPPLREKGRTLNSPFFFLRVIPSSFLGGGVSPHLPLFSLLFPFPLVAKKRKIHREKRKSFS